MAYLKQLWVDKDATNGALVASRFNHIEDGIEAAHQLAEAPRAGHVVAQGEITSPTTNSTATSGPGNVPLRALNALIEADVAYQAEFFFPITIFTPTAAGRLFTGTLRHRAANTVDAFAAYVNFISATSWQANAQRPYFGTATVNIPANHIPAGLRDFEFAFAPLTAGDSVQFYGGLGPGDTFGIAPCTLTIRRVSS